MKYLSEAKKFRANKGSTLMFVRIFLLSLNFSTNRDILSMDNYYSCNKPENVVELETAYLGGA